MGSKNAIPGHVMPVAAWKSGLNLFKATAVSGTTVYTSPTFNAAILDNIGIQIAFAGTMTGTLVVQCSIDNVNFIPLTFTPALAQPSGSNLSYLINLNQLPFPYLQVSYTNASGSGTLTAYLSAKDLN